MFDGWGSTQMPNTLPAGYGEVNAGEHGRLMVNDVGPQITTEAPFRGPDGTSPLNRGDPNLPAHTMPLPTQLPTSQSMVIPAALAGADVRLVAQEYGGGSPPTQSLGASVATYRDVAGAGGYLYRQFRDGTIKILSGPVPSLVGVTLSPTRYAANWKAVTKEIGTFQHASTSGSRIAQALSIAAGLTSQARQQIVRQQAQAQARPMPDTYTPPQWTAAQLAARNEMLGDDFMPGASRAVAVFPYVVGGIAIVGLIVFLGRR
jgi:hypothetical protein